MRQACHQANYHNDEVAHHTPRPGAEGQEAKNGGEDARITYGRFHPDLNYVFLRQTQQELPTAGFNFLGAAPFLSFLFFSQRGHVFTPSIGFKLISTHDLMSRITLFDQRLPKSTAREHRSFTANRNRHRQNLARATGIETMGYLREAIVALGCWEVYMVEILLRAFAGVTQTA